MGRVASDWAASNNMQKIVYAAAACNITRVRVSCKQSPPLFPFC